MNPLAHSTALLLSSTEIMFMMAFDEPKEAMGMDDNSTTVCLVAMRLTKRQEIWLQVLSCPCHVAWEVNLATCKVGVSLPSLLHWLGWSEAIPDVTQVERPIQMQAPFNSRSLFSGTIPSWINHNQGLIFLTSGSGFDVEILTRKEAYNNTWASPWVRRTDFDLQAGQTTVRCETPGITRLS